MKVTFGAVEKPPAVPLKIGDFVFPNYHRDRVLFIRNILVPWDDPTKLRYVCVVMNPGYNFNDLGRELISNLGDATKFDSAELIVRR